MPTPQPTRLISRDTHTTPLPGGVVEKALSLLATGTITERLRAAQLLATAWADDEERRLAEEALRLAAEDHPAAPTEPDATDG